MFKRIIAIILLIASLLVLPSCDDEQASAKAKAKAKRRITVTEYVSGLTTKKIAPLQEKLDLLMHPLKDAVALYGDNYILTWDGVYITLDFLDADCSVEAYVGAEFEEYDWYNNFIDINDCNVMEYLSYIPIERVILKEEGTLLTDGITVGMSAKNIAKKLKVSSIDYQDSASMITTETDGDGKQVKAYYNSDERGDVFYIVVFHGNDLARVEFVTSHGYLTKKKSDSDHGKQLITDAFAFVTENKLASFDMQDLAYQGTIYSSHYDSWFDNWTFTKGDYEGYEINVEQAPPHRIYISAAFRGFPFLFWCDGSYVDPMLSFVGKWRNYNDLTYIDIKSISKEGIVVFDMYTDVGKETTKMVLVENLSTVLNEIPQTLDEYLYAEAIAESLDGDVQLCNDEVQSGYYIYGGDKIYLIDSLLLSLDGSVQYLPRSMTARVGCGPLPMHIPQEEPQYTQESTWGYMEYFGRDDQNEENILKTNATGGEALLNEYLNKVYKTSGISYAGTDYKYLYDYVFPVNDATYHVWESTYGESSHYLYVDSVNQLILRESRSSVAAKYAKDLIYKDRTLVSTKSYANQVYSTLDQTITIDLINRTITNTNSTVQRINISDVGLDTVRGNERYMFFANVGERYIFNGYLLFDHTTWGATLHITDSNIPDFKIGMYYLNCDQFFLDSTIGVVGVPEDDGEKYLDDTVSEIQQETKLVVREYSGKIIGYIYVKENGDKTVKNFSGKILGYYYADRDVTTDFYGKILTRGDTSSALLFSQ